MTKNEERGSTRVTDVLKYNQAIRRAKISGPKKGILFVLSSLADPKTGIIPDRFQPSLTNLARYAGLGRSTAARCVPELEGEGWFKKSAPTVQQAWRDKETNNYLLTIPVSMLADLEDELVPERDQSQRGTSPAEGLVPERDAETSEPEAGLVPERDRTSPGAGHELTPSNPTTNYLSSSAAPPKGDEGEGSKKSKRVRKSEPYRDDVEQICLHLVERMVENGCRRPTITDIWRREARLLIDEPRPEPVTVEKILALIDWCQKDSFWRSTIQSMPKFREKYDTLRLRAVEDWNRKNRPTGGGARQPWRADTTRSREERFARPTKK